MKIKGINPIEQHFEKGVVGVVGALALAAVALQFLTSPNSVEDSASTPGARKEKLPPNRAYDLVVEDANALKALVTSNSPVFDEPPPVYVAPPPPPYYYPYRYRRYWDRPYRGPHYHFGWGFGW